MTRFKRSFAHWNAAAVILVVVLITISFTGAVQAGPKLPPAEYKPLPEGTVIQHADREIKIQESDGFAITLTSSTRKPLWMSVYGHLGEFGTDIFATHQGTNSSGMNAVIDGDNRAKIEKFWPLEVGKKAAFEILNEAPNVYTSLSYTKVEAEVLRTETVKVGDYLYDTYVIGEKGRTGNAISYAGKKWYHPPSGLIVKAERKWSSVGAAGYTRYRWKSGDEDNYEIASVEYPEGTKNLTLARRLAPTKNVSSDQLAGVLSEAKRLKEIAQAESQRRSTEVAKLKADSRRTQLRQEQEIARLTRSLTKGPAAGAQSKSLAEYGAVDFGQYHALVIGSNDYKYLPKLGTAIDDAKGVASVLKENYGYKVRTLINATSGEIFDALDEYREQLGPNDNLLIYYAGHGWLDEDTDRGYWLPVNAKPNRRRNWISNAAITDSMKGLDAKHVMVVADSCYSGTLVRGANIALRGLDYIRRMSQKRARLALTSGGLEPVADKGGGKHSPFAQAFINTLKANEGVMDGTRMFSEMRKPIMLNADQTPEYSDVRKAGHDGGDFLFIRKK